MIYGPWRVPTRGGTPMAKDFIRGDLKEDLGVDIQAFERVDENIV